MSHAIIAELAPSARAGGAVVSIENLQKQYRRGLFGKGVRALDGVTFEVQPGEIFALLGRNGAGKTTLIKILLGIIRRTGGSASMLGYPAGDRRGRNRVGYLPERLRLPRHHTARTALDFYGRLSGLSGSEIRSRQDALIRRVGLEGRDRESITRYSKGMLQRLGLAQALLHDPELLILDEPTDGLDPEGRSEVRSILCSLRDEGRTVFLNSHILQEVELICDRVAILDQGQLKFVGDPADLHPEGEGDLELELKGSVPALQRVIPDWKPDPRWRDGQPHEICVFLKSQSDADALIDQIRAADISIIRLAWKGRTLEDQFLRLIRQ